MWPSNINHGGQGTVNLGITISQKKKKEEYNVQKEKKTVSLCKQILLDTKRHEKKKEI